MRKTNKLLVRATHAMKSRKGNRLAAELLIKRVCWYYSTAQRIEKDQISIHMKIRQKFVFCFVFLSSLYFCNRLCVITLCFCFGFCRY